MTTENKTIKTSEHIVRESKSTPGNFYIIYGTNEDGSDGQVMVPANIARKWDDIDEVRLGKRTFSKQMNAETGLLEDKIWSRLEIVGVVDVIAQATKTARKYEAKSLVLNAATNFNKAKKEALAEAELGEEAKKELEAMLQF